MINQVEGDTYTDEPLAFLLEDASIKETISPYYMGRIVDFPAFISSYPFKPDSEEREWEFELTDPIMECNQGSFRLTISRDGHGIAERIIKALLRAHQYPDDDDYADGLQTSGLPRPHRPDQGDRADVLDMLEDAIEQQTPFISDYF